MLHRAVVTEASINSVSFFTYLCSFLVRAQIRTVKLSNLPVDIDRLVQLGPLQRRTYVHHAVQT